ncbi:MAG: tRNA(Ile)(2)-agmatinylcytidine synthase [Candidatus Thorarchaeota archaeon]|nr:tRNA(Ile)(2)-agmatinylcytidine synthase [Candidatus Thorarchaeota archaeon]
MGSESVSLGMDDIDSPTGGCTTHFASLLVERLEPLIEEWKDYPHLIRLNPNIPYRTRGNGGVCLNFTIDSNEIGEIIPLVTGMVQKYADLKYPNTNPGVAIVNGEIPSTLKSFSQKAVWRTVPKSLAFRIADEHQIDYFTHGNGRGLVGALAAIGHGLEGDHTYEYLAYRKMSETHEDRGVEKSSVETMNAKMGNRTFSNLDLTNDTMLIEPHGPDPVLYGIRGEEPQDVIEAASYIKSSQEIDRWMVFRTNQGTGEHLSHHFSIDELRPYMSASLTAEIVEAPHIISGGHAIFAVSDSKHSIQCAAYEPTGDFRWDVMKLRVGDKLTIHSGVRPQSHSYDITLNVEGMLINQLADHVEYSNPLCDHCNRRMKSAGKDKGFKCPHCGHREREHKKVEHHVPRELQLGYYLPRPGAQRHLTRPHSRVGKQNLFSTKLIEIWHNP